MYFWMSLGLDLKIKVTFDENELQILKELYVWDIKSVLKMWDILWPVHE